MKVLPEYIVVKKVSDVDIYVSEYYKSEYQVCEIVDSNDFEVGDRIFVGNKIFFEKANDYGDDTFYIYLEDVFAVVKDGLIIPSNDIVYIEADKDKKANDSGLYRDISYKPLETENVTQDGIVLSVCKKAKDSYFHKDLKIEIEPGDHVYTHHFLTDHGAERNFNGKTYYEIKYEDLYCKIVGGNIIMLNEWNFITPIENEILEMHGFQLETTAKLESRVGIVKVLSDSLRKKGIQKGDKIIFKKGREYNIDVEGDRYYRINTKDILYKLN